MTKTFAISNALSSRYALDHYEKITAKDVERNMDIKQIIKNSQDIYAINDFCFLATYNNIIHYSEFMYGNSAPLEQMMLFPEILEDNDQE